MHSKIAVISIFIAGAVKCYADPSDNMLLEEAMERAKSMAPMWMNQKIGDLKVSCLSKAVPVKSNGEYITVFTPIADKSGKYDCRIKVENGGDDDVQEIAEIKKFVPEYLGKLYTNVDSVTINGTRATVNATLQKQHCTLELFSLDRPPTENATKKPVDWVVDKVECN